MRPDHARPPGASTVANPGAKHPLPFAALRKGPWLFIVGILGLLLFFRSHFRLCLVKGESMLPRFHSGDLLVVDTLAYRAADPSRGDIVLAHNGQDLIVKRIVGLPGEEVELHRGILLVNRRPFTEDYAVEPGRLSVRRGRLSDDRYALLGDNRSVPLMLSVHAVVPKHQILGRVVHSIRFGGPSS